MKKLETIYAYLFYMFCFFVPFEKHLRAVPNVILIALGLLFPFIINKGLLKSLVKDKENIALFLLIVFLVVQGVAISGLNDDFGFIINTASVLCIWVAAFPIKNIDRAKFSFSISVFICAIISLINILLYVINNGGFNFSNGAEINDILIIERIYLGTLCVLCVAFSIDLIKKHPKYKIPLFLNGIICTSLMFIISARIAIITLFFLFLYRVLLLKNNKIKLKITAVSIVLAIIFFSTNKNLQKRFFYVDKDHSFIENLKIWEPRIAIWNCAYELATDNEYNPIIGYGLYQTRQRLQLCYSETINNESKNKWFLESRYNIHNQFLDFLIGYGLIGFILFTFVVFYGVFQQKSKFSAISVIITIVLFGTVESFLQRQIGVYLFALILAFNAYDRRMIKLKNGKD